MIVKVRVTGHAESPAGRRAELHLGRRPDARRDAGSEGPGETAVHLFPRGEGRGETMQGAKIGGAVYRGTIARVVSEIRADHRLVKTFDAIIQGSARRHFLAPAE